MRSITRLSAFWLLALAVASPAFSQEEEKPKLGWSDKGEVAWALTAGNAESNTISLANTLEYRWDRALFKFYLFGLRAKTTDKIFYEVVDGEGNSTVVERELSNVSAERYVLALNYESKFTDRMYWFAGTGWERDQPSGIDSRFLITGGVGNIWFENDGSHFKTSYGLNYTWEDWTSGGDTNYFGGNITLDWLWKFSPNASFQTVDILFLNFDEFDDWRINSTNALTVQMSKLLALKVGLQFLYDAQPQDQEYTLYGPYGTSTGTVTRQLDKLDTIFTTSLVVGF